LQEGAFLIDEKNMEYQWHIADDVKLDEDQALWCAVGVEHAYRRANPGDVTIYSTIEVLAALLDVREDFMSVQIIDPTVAMPPRRHPLEPLPLFAGDRLSRAEFERRYHAQPALKKAELIEGVVYMPSPVKYKLHGNPHLYLNTWVGVYLAATPGVDGGDNATVRMDNQNERINGGRSFIGPDDYLEGAPELVIEIAATSASYDLHDKKRVYARNGVREYLVALTYEQQLQWFVLREGEYVELSPSADGILRSEIFPGLWLRGDALWQDDLAGLLAVLQQGIASAEHAAFVAGLK
jgi:Uma2 family endonuclease